MSQKVADQIINSESSSEKKDGPSESSNPSSTLFVGKHGAVYGCASATRLIGTLYLRGQWPPLPVQTKLWNDKWRSNGVENISGVPYWKFENEDLIAKYSL